MRPITFTSNTGTENIYACGCCGTVYTSVPHRYPQQVMKPDRESLLRNKSSALERAELCCRCCKCGVAFEVDKKKRRKTELPKSGMYQECDPCKMKRFYEEDKAYLERRLKRFSTIIPLAEYQPPFIAILGHEEYIESDAVEDWLRAQLDDSDGDMDEPVFHGVKLEQVKVNFIGAFEDAHEYQHEEFEFSTEAFQELRSFGHYWNEKYSQTVWVDDPETRVDCSALWNSTIDEYRRIDSDGLLEDER